MTNQSERLKNLISQMILTQSYWGYLFGRIRRVSSDTLPSIMGVCPEKDGTLSLKFRPEMMENTDDDTLKIILEHEGLHVLNKHVPRLLRIISNEISMPLKKEKADVWNTASDCAANELMGMPDELMIDGTPWQMCKPELYELPEKQAVEFYFNALWEKKQDSEDNEHYGEGEVYDTLDDHGPWSEVVNEVSDVSSLSRKVDNYSKSMIGSALKMFGKSRGELPSYMRALIEEALRPPKAPYFQIVRNLVVGTRLSKFKRHFSKINRKRTYVFAIGDKNIPQISPFPGRTRDFTFNIGIVLDTSGSQSLEDIQEGLSGCKNIIENDRHCKVTILEVDTRIHNEYEIKKLRDIQFEVKGRGGTRLSPGLERCKELNVDVAIVFTDGWCENINSLSRSKFPKKIIWVIEGKDGTAENVNQTGYIVRI